MRSFLLIRRRERPAGKVFRPFLLCLCLLFDAVCPASAACPDEPSSSLESANRIYREWPLRPVHDEPTRFLQQLGDRLIRRFGDAQRWPGHLDWPQDGWKFTLARNLSVNAFSIGNGRIYVTDGTFNFVHNEAELAAILAHEISHQLAGHFCRPAPDFNSHRQEFGSLVQVVNFQLEMEADDLALNILLLGGFPPSSLLDVIRRLPLAGDGHQHRTRISTLDHKLRIMGSLPKTASSREFKRIKKSLSQP